MSKQAVAPLSSRWSSRWQQMLDWTGLGMIFIPVGERLLELYSEKARHYHRPEHVLSCLDALESYPGSVRDNDSLELALWFHDALHVNLRHPSEDKIQSARFFESEFGILAEPSIDTKEVTRLILATRHTYDPLDSDEALIMDIDFGILGADKARYESYAEGLKKEHSSMSDEDYRELRTDKLRGLLCKKSIYWTKHFRRFLEVSARANIEDELDALLCMNEKT